MDPAGFVNADSKIYVGYRFDGTSLGGGGPYLDEDQSHNTPIMLQDVSGTDGYELIGAATALLHLGPYGGPLIEAPSLVRTPNAPYVLLLSSTCCITKFNGTSYAISTSVARPYTRSLNPLLVAGTEALLSPGGADMLADESSIVFHTDVNPSDASVRRMYTSKIKISGMIVSLA